jgi:hypothetical protein
MILLTKLELQIKWHNSIKTTQVLWNILVKRQSFLSFGIMESRAEPIASLYIYIYIYIYIMESDNLFLNIKPCPIFWEGANSLQHSNKYFNVF